MKTPYIRTEKGLYGILYHYDASGNRVGESRPGLFDGEYNHISYDNGYEGYSTPGITADLIHYDAEGSVSGFSIDGPIAMTHYGLDGYAGASYADNWGASTYFDD